VKPVRFQWNQRNAPADGKLGMTQYGFTAQQLDSVVQKHNASWINLVHKENSDKWEVTPDRLLPVVVKAIQEIEESRQVEKTVNKEVYNSGIINHDYSKARIWAYENVPYDFTANFINVPNDDDSLLTGKLIVKQGPAPALPNTIEINGDSTIFKWKDGIKPTGKSNAIDVIELTFYKDNDEWVVLGELKSFQ
jgi:hypothetical protein